MPDSIYYTAKLQSIAVKLLVRYPPYAIVQTISGNRYSVPAHRIIPLAAQKRGGLPRDLIDRRPPKNYLSIADFLATNNLNLDKEQQVRFANLCGRECAKSGIKSWHSKPGARNGICYFPVEIIKTVFARLTKL
jgi:hypothetical protein